jgi:phage regulator Rha-like protein
MVNGICSRNVAEEVGKQHKAVIRDKGRMKAENEFNGNDYTLLSYNKIALTGYKSIN